MLEASVPSDHSHWPRSQDKWSAGRATVAPWDHLTYQQTSFFARQQ